MIPHDQRPLWRPLEGRVSRIAFGSCAAAGTSQPILRRIAAAKPELFVYAGGTIHAPTRASSSAPISATSLRRGWTRLTASEDWRYLAERVPLAGAYAEHDFGPPRGDLPLEQLSKHLFLDAFGEPADSARRRRRGLYGSRVLESHGKRIQLILLDTRTFRSPQVLAERPADAGGSLGKFAIDEREGATILGDAQWGWLYAQLEEEVDLRLIASSTQVLAAHKGMDQWTLQPRERRQLTRVALQHVMLTSSPTILLSGNAHFAEISAKKIRVSHSDDWFLLDFTSSGLTHTEPVYAAAPNPARVAGPFTELNFGLIEVDWDAEGGPLVRLSAVGADGSVGFEHVTNLAFVPFDEAAD